MINQKKLNGRPRTLGSMRSHKDTVKQIATNGIRANRIAPTDGLRNDAPWNQIQLMNHPKRGTAMAVILLQKERKGKR